MHQYGHLAGKTAGSFVCNEKCWTGDLGYIFLEGGKENHTIRMHKPFKPRR